MRTFFWEKLIHKSSCAWQLENVWVWGWGAWIKSHLSGYLTNYWEASEETFLSVIKENMALCCIQVAIQQWRSSAFHTEMTSYLLASEACWDFLPKEHPLELKEGQGNRATENLMHSESRSSAPGKRMHKIYFTNPPSSWGPCSSAEVGLAGISSAAPEAQNSWKPHPPRASEAKCAGLFPPGGCLLSVMWAG